MALSSAGTTGTITTSAIPFGRSSGATGGNTYLEPVERQVRPPCDEVLTEVPFPVARSILVKRQRLEQRIANTHREAALRLSQHDLGDQRLAAFQHAVCFCDTQRAGSAIDLDADHRAAQRRIGGSAPVEV